MVTPGYDCGYSPWTLGFAGSYGGYGPKYITNLAVLIIFCHAYPPKGRIYSLELMSNYIKQSSSFFRLEMALPLDC